jgi:hypothetical protein
MRTKATSAGSGSERAGRSLRRSDMRRLIATLIAAAAFTIAGCGSEDADPTSGGGDGDRTSDSEPTQQPEREPTVQSVTLTRTGGIAGVNESWRVGPTDVGHRPVFEAASKEALNDADTGAGKTPPCCDLFQYTVVVAYTDGDTATYRMYDGGTTDPALDRLVDAVLETKPLPTDTSAAPR